MFIISKYYLILVVILLTGCSTAKLSKINESFKSWMDQQGSSKVCHTHSNGAGGTFTVCQ